MSSFAFGYGYSKRQRRTALGAPAEPMSNIISIEVLGAALLPDGADGAIPNGWVVKIIVPYDAVATFDPTKITLSCLDPGFDKNRVAVQVPRTLTCTKLIRQQLPNGANILSSLNAGQVTYYAALPEDIYALTTVVRADAAVGFYGAAVAGRIATVTNSSLWPYQPPLLAWENRQQERATGSTFRVGLYVYHEQARNAQAVAAVDFLPTDHLGTAGATISVNDPTLSVMVNQQQYELMQADIALSPLAQATTSAHFCTCDVDVYPWIGQKWRLSSNGTAWPSANPDVQLRFVNDKNGTYGGAHAAVQIGAVGGTVQSSRAAALTTPFPTIEAAAAALPAWNNTNKGHNDHSGATLWLMETTPGAGASHSPGAAITPVAGSCWSEIKKDPAATGVVNVNMAVTRSVSSLWSWQVDITQSANAGLDGATANGYIMADFANMTLTTGTSIVPINFRCGATWFRNATVPALANTNGNPFFSASPSSKTQCVAILGCTITATADCAMAAGFIGATSTRQVKLSEYDPAVYTTYDSFDGRVIANVRTRDMRVSTVLCVNRSYTKGMVLANVIIERAVVASVAALQIGADGTTVAFKNVILSHVLIPGGLAENRINIGYNDVAGAVGVVKRFQHYNCIFSRFNSKTDTYTANTTVTGRVGNWRAIFGTGSSGSIVMAGSDSGDTSPGYRAPNGNWLGENWPVGTATNVGKANVPFTNDQAGGAGSLGMGDYLHNGPVSAAYDRIAAGRARQKWDMAGVLRRNDGTGADGPYERTVG